MAVAFGRDYLTRKTLDDEYLMWLLFANAGMQNPGNLFLIDLAVHELPTTSPIIEIGSFCGLSTNAIRYLLHKHGRSNQIPAVDPWTFERSQTRADARRPDDHDGRVHRVRDRRVPSERCFLFAGDAPDCDSDDLGRLLSELAGRATVTTLDGEAAQLGGTISFAYIDGNHTYEYCRRDFDNTDRHLDVGGLILFDDSADSDPFGLTRLMKELHRPPALRARHEEPELPLPQDLVEVTRGHAEAAAACSHRAMARLSSRRTLVRCRPRSSPGSRSAATSRTAHAPGSSPFCPP